MKLMKQSNSDIVFENLVLADTLISRTVGLLGKKGLGPKEALWITRCNAIHTFFMKFPIDCVFFDKQGKIKKIYHNVQPWRWAGPVWGATAVIEMAAGQARDKKLNEGDVIECGP